MNTFSHDSFKKRLADLNASQQSIQTLSLWLIHHRKNAKAAVNIWIRALEEAPTEKKLTFLYLANDVVQNSKKKGPEYSQEFATLIGKAYEIVSSEVSDEKTLSSMERMIKIWEERGVYAKDIISGLKLAMVKGKKKQRDKLAEDMNRKRKYTQDLDDIVYELTGSPKEKDAVPDTEEVLELLKKLQKSASSDAVTRRKIAALPTEVADVKALEQLPDKASADRLYKQVEDAYILVSEYNSRLEEEMEDRNKLAAILPQFVALQKEEQKRLQDELQNYRDKLAEAGRIKKELDKHIDSLPDLSSLPPPPLQLHGDLPTVLSRHNTNTTDTPAVASVDGAQSGSSTANPQISTHTDPDIKDHSNNDESSNDTKRAENNSTQPLASIGNLLPDDIDIDQFFD